jgi:S-disulfanyl-L-cysteine oxidoreductase SoxD
MRVNRTVAILAVAAVGALCGGAAVGHGQRASGDETLPRIWTGVYTAEQAEQGKVPFTGLCRRCHSDNLEGSERGPALKGELFMANWDQQDLDRLRAKIRDTMPPDDPGKLTEDDYVGLVSYILQANGYPAGTTNLDGGALSSIQLVRKPGEERELRSFSLVQVVGCLSQGADRSWVLTRASEPVLTRDRPSNAEELTRADARPLGGQTFQLVSVSPFQPDANAGRKIEVKGLLYKSPTKNRVNVSSLQAVGSCSE